ncbi:MAG: methyltransferase domain-containing protein [Myxococcota bacterium]
MSLSRATFRGRSLGLPAGPVDPALLVPWVGKRITLPSDDPFVRGSGGEAHGYIDGARGGWTDHPEYMDFLDLSSPVYALKRMERDLYLHHWAAHLPDAGATVLDVGAGIGRFTMAMLDRGAVVHAVDPDLESLRRLVWHAAGRAGRLEASWASVHHLPDVVADVAIAAEVLCYVPDDVGALTGIAARLRTGGVVLLSVEARYGWAAAQDAPTGGIEAALGGDGIVAIDGDRWVRTATADDVQRLVERAGLTLVSCVGSHWLPDGPLEDAMPAELDLAGLVALEDRCRAHPVWGPLNRLWLAVARKP